MDERIFLRDIDDDGLVVRALLTTLQDFQEQFRKMETDLRCIRISDEGTGLRELSIQNLEMRTKVMQQTAHWAIKDCAQRQRRLRDRADGLADLQVDEETLELDPGPE